MRNLYYFHLYDDSTLMFDRFTNGFGFTLNAVIVQSTNIPFRIRMQCGCRGCVRTQVADPERWSASSRRSVRDDCSGWLASFGGYLDARLVVGYFRVKAETHKEHALKSVGRWF